MSAPRDTVDPAKHVWVAGLDEEVQYWREAIRAAPPESWGPRPLREDVAALLDEVQAPVPHILDVGAGPFTGVGTFLPGRPVKVVAVDPLADAYNDILDALGITPALRTSWCHGELVHERFPADTFDVVFSHNALDHSYAPDRAIRSGLHVLKPGATMLLRHWINEGERGSYGGLHQWNFDCQEGRFVIWNRTERLDVSALLAPWAEVACRVEQKQKLSGRIVGFLDVRLRKRPDPPPGLITRSR